MAVGFSHGLRHFGLSRNPEAPMRLVDGRRAGPTPFSEPARVEFSLVGTHLSCELERTHDNRTPYAVDRSGGGRNFAIGRTMSANGFLGEFFTGAQSVEHAKPLNAEVAKLAGDAATVQAVIGASEDPAVEPKTGDRMRYETKRVAGVWKIDDFRNLESCAQSQPAAKTLFNDPVRYGRRARPRL
jgi:hypothetical protein